MSAAIVNLPKKEVSEKRIAIEVTPNGLYIVQIKLFENTFAGSLEECFEFIRKHYGEQP